MPKYKRIASTRKQQVEVSINAKGWKDDRTQIRITGPLNIKQVDYKEKGGDWETIYDGDIILLKRIVHKDGSEVGLLVWKPTGDFIAFSIDEGRNLKRLKRDSYYMYLGLLKFFKHESGIAIANSNKKVTNYE